MASLNIRKMLPLGVYAVVALAIVGPWLRPGYIFALDMVFTPHLRMPDTVTSSYIFHAFLHILNFVLPSSVIQKLLLFGIFFLAGFGAHRLVRFVAPSRVGAYFGGVLYAVNPFVYDRLMTGQYSVLLGYALLPFFVRSLLLFLQKPRLRSSIFAALWATIIGVISIHTLGPTTIIALVAGAIWFIKNRHAQAWNIQFLRYSAAGLGAFVLLNCYWLVPLLLGKGRTAEQIAGFTNGDAAAFATVGGTFMGKLLHVLSLRGFWAESHDLYLQPSQPIGTWGLLILLTWLLVAIGFVNLWSQRQRALAAFFGSVIAIGCVLGIGFGWMQHVPLLAGFREPQKFVSLVALGFAVASGIGVTTLKRFIKNEFDSATSAIIAAGIALLMPLFITPTIFWGAGGQLAARSYPPEWSAINKQLNADNERFNTLFLPWHLYMRFGFANRVVTSPAAQYFDKPVIVSDQAELDRAASVHPTSATQKLDRLLPRAAHTVDFAKQLAGLNIKYIVLDREEDYQTYDYLHRAPGLHQIAQQGSLELYLNEQYGGHDETR